MYHILKSYENNPHKTHMEEKNISLQKAKIEIDLNASLWHKNGGIIISNDGMKLVVEESDGSEVITWEIVETN